MKGLPGKTLLSRLRSAVPMGLAVLTPSTEMLGYFRDEERSVLKIRISGDHNREPAKHQ